MAKPKISVIVPVYNVEYYLDETLKSLLNQTIINDIEVLMIDDGSTDNSRYIVEKYALDYDNFYAFHKENGGLCSARNFGLNIACGEYIHFMDADDLIMPNAYEETYNFAIKNNYDVITFDFLKFDNEKTWKTPIAIDVFKEGMDNIENTNLYEYNELSWDMIACNKLMKKEFLDKNNIRFYYKDIIHEDNPFMTELYSKAKTVGVLNKILYFWRIRDVGTSITQVHDINKGKKLYEMACLVNSILTRNIHDPTILDKKYKKILTLDLFNFMTIIKKFSRKDQEYMFESLCDMVDLVPELFFENLNTYFKVIYDMVKNRDLDNLLKFLSYNLQTNPNLPNDFNPNYANKLDFKKDAYNENLNSSAKNIFLEDEFIVIDSKNFVPFNPIDNFKKITFKMLNDDFKEVILNFENILENKLYIPIDSINVGKNLILTCYYFDNIAKESYMKTEINKTFIFDDFDIIIKRGKTGHLNIIKHQKNDVELIIDDIQLYGEKIQLKGHSNERLEDITIVDMSNLVNFTFPIKYLHENNNNTFLIDIDLDYFINLPLKKFNVGSNFEFNKIALIKDYKFLNEKYFIFIRNHYNTIQIELKLYNPTNEIKTLIKKNNKLNKSNNDLINVNNYLKQGIANLTHEISCINYFYYDMIKDIQFLEDWSWHKINQNIEIHSDISIKNNVRIIKATQIKNGGGTYRYSLDKIISGDFEINLQLKRLDYNTIRLSLVENLEFNFNPQDTRCLLNDVEWHDYKITRIGTKIEMYKKPLDSNTWTTVILENNTEDIGDKDCYLNFMFYYNDNKGMTKTVCVRNLKIIKL